MKKNVKGRWMKPTSFLFVNFMGYNEEKKEVLKNGKEEISFIIQYKRKEVMV